MPLIRSGLGAQIITNGRVQNYGDGGGFSGPNAPYYFAAVTTEAVTFAPLSVEEEPTINEVVLNLTPADSGGWRVAYQTEIPVGDSLGDLFAWEIFLNWRSDFDVEGTSKWAIVADGNEVEVGDLISEDYFAITDQLGVEGILTRSGTLAYPLTSETFHLALIYQITTSGDFADLFIRSDSRIWLGTPFIGGPYYPIGIEPFDYLEQDPYEIWQETFAPDVNLRVLWQRDFDLQGREALSWEIFFKLRFVLEAPESYVFYLSVVSPENREDVGTILNLGSTPYLDNVIAEKTGSALDVYIVNGVISDEIMQNNFSIALTGIIDSEGDSAEVSSLSRFWGNFRE